MFEYCRKIGDQAITLIANACGPYLEALTVTRNIWLKSAKISDLGMTALSNNCPNLRKLSLTFVRDFEEQTMIQLQKIKNLRYLQLKSCPLFSAFGSFENLVELDISGDSWIRLEVLQSVSKCPNLVSL